MEQNLLKVNSKNSYALPVALFQFGVVNFPKKFLEILRTSLWNRLFVQTLPRMFLVKFLNANRGTCSVIKVFLVTNRVFKSM